MIILKLRTSNDERKQSLILWWISGIKKQVSIWLSQHTALGEFQGNRVWKKNQSRTWKIFWVEEMELRIWGKPRHLEFTEDYTGEEIYVQTHNSRGLQRFPLSIRLSIDHCICVRRTSDAEKRNSSKVQRLQSLSKAKSQE